MRILLSLALSICLLVPAQGAFTATAFWDVQTTGHDTNNGGCFDTGVAGFPTDGAATSGTGSAPVFSSASYNFVAGDVGNYVYIKSGTNWIPGWYVIASVAANAATLTASVGSVTLITQTLNTTAGVSTTASPTGATWGLDYSKKTTPFITFTDMVIGGTTTTFTSVLNPVGKNFVGNCISITSGTGFTVQRVAIVSTSTITATCDKSLGTTASAGGNGGLGGAIATIGKAFSLFVSGNIGWVGTGTYTISSSTQPGSSVGFGMYGWNAVRGDSTSTRPLITTSSLTVWMLATSAGTSTSTVKNLAFSSTNGTPGQGFLAGSGTDVLRVENCTFTGFGSAIQGVLASLIVSNSSFTSNAGGIFNMTTVAIADSYFSANSAFHISTITGLTITNSILVNSSAGPAIFQPTYGIIRGNSFYNNNGGSYATIYLNGASLLELLVEDNIIYGDGSHPGILTSATGAGSILSRYNAFGNNSPNYGTGTSAGPGDVALSANPYTNAAGGDFSLNSTAGGGAAVKALGFPGAFIGAASTTAFPDIGAVQSAAGATAASGASGFVF